MILYVMRHADALRVGGPIQRDADRPLSPKGEEDAALIARVVSRLDPTIDLILTSPLLRAVQTGDRFRAALGDRVSRRATENLSPGFRSRALLEELSAGGTHTAVVCIGHEPDLSRFIASLITESGRAVLAMPPSAVARIRFTSGDLSGEATLQELLTPDTVRALQS